jgi:energy-coupling factor transport system ATP-binding protein
MAQIATDLLSYRYSESEKQALHNVTLQIHAGEFVAIVGANNSGKSTLCYALAGVVPHLYHGKIEGKVLIDGIDNKYRTISEIAQHVGLVLQVPCNQMSGVRYTVFEEVAFGLENRGVPREKIQERVKTVLALLGLEKFATYSPFELSGGQQQRLALATILAVDPTIIILDEPTTFLDPQGAELVFDILRQLQQQGKTIIIAEQRLELIAQYANRVIAFDKGHLVMDGVPREVLTSSTMQSIQLNWTRFTQVAHLARKKGLLQADTPLPASLRETIDTFAKQ